MSDKRCVVCGEEAIFSRVIYMNLLRLEISAVDVCDVHCSGSIDITNTEQEVTEQ